MALTLDPNGYKWDFESALELPGAPAGPFSDKGVGTCHGPVNGDDQFVFVTLVDLPHPSRNVAEGGDFHFASAKAREAPALRPRGWPI